MKELESENPLAVGLTLVQKDGQHYVVSTICIDNELTKSLDTMLVTMGSLFGMEDDERVRKFATPGTHETLVFESDDEGDVEDWEEKDFVRYDNEEEAKEGHLAMVKKWDSEKV